MHERILVSRGLMATGAARHEECMDGMDGVMDLVPWPSVCQGLYG